MVRKVAGPPAAAALGELAPPAPRANQDVRPADRFEGVTAVEKAAPYGRLAAMGDFSGFVSTEVGEVHVQVRPGRDVGQRPPVVFLDGLDANGRQLATDETVIRLDLKGQLRTLARDIQTNGGRSLQRDIDPKDQVKAVIGALDALGVRAPVHVFGLSYGGMIAALTKQAHPDRIGKLMLCAPYVHALSAGDPVRDVARAMLMNPFNPMGSMMYRAATRAVLAPGTATVPPALLPYAPMYGEALYRLSMGLEQYRLEDVVKGMPDVHVLSAPADPMSPPVSSWAAYEGAESGSYTLAPWHLTMQHDLVRMAPTVVRRFIDEALGADDALALAPPEGEEHE